MRQPRLWWDSIEARDSDRFKIVPAFLAGVAIITPIASIAAHNSRTSMWPIYGTSFMLAAYFLWRTFHRAPPRKKGLWPAIGRISIGFIAITPAASSALFTIAFPVISLPTPTGQYPHIGVTYANFTDTSRGETLSTDPNDKRTLQTTIYYPAEINSVPNEPVTHLSDYDLPSEMASLLNPPKFLHLATSTLFDHTRLINTHSYEGLRPHQSHPFPILFYSPGYGPFSQDIIPLAEELASHGYIVVTTDHPYTSGYKTLPLASDTTTEQHNAHLIQRSKDLSFLLDRMIAANQDPSSIFHGAIDTNKVGILGFSYGAATAVQTLATDPRFKSGFALDGTFFGDMIDNKEIAQPLLLALNTNAVERYSRYLKGKKDPHSENPQEKSSSARMERALKIMGRPKGKRWTVTMKDSIHRSYNFIPSLAPALYNAPHNAAEVGTIRALAIDYFNHTLLGEAPKILGKNGDYPRPLVFFAEPAWPVIN